MVRLQCDSETLSPRLFLLSMACWFHYQGGDMATSSTGILAHVSCCIFSCSQPALQQWSATCVVSRPSAEALVVGQSRLTICTDPSCISVSRTPCHKQAGCCGVVPSAQNVYTFRQCSTARQYLRRQRTDVCTKLSGLYCRPMEQLMLAYCWLPSQYALVFLRVLMCRTWWPSGWLPTSCRPALSSAAAGTCRALQASCSRARRAATYCMLVAGIQARTLAAAGAPAALSALGQHPL